MAERKKNNFNKKEKRKAKHECFEKNSRIFFFFLNYPDFSTFSRGQHSLRIRGYPSGWSHPVKAPLVSLSANRNVPDFKTDNIKLSQNVFLIAFGRKLKQYFNTHQTFEMFFVLLSNSILYSVFYDKTNKTIFKARFNSKRKLYILIFFIKLTVYTLSFFQSLEERYRKNKHFILYSLKYSP